MALVPADKIEETLPAVAIVGRVNVGKSTLFNRICDTQRALISKQAGTTRTNNRGIAHWRGTPFRVIDTGGMGTDGDDPFADDVLGQIDLALKQASVVLFLVDVQKPLDEDEKLVATRLLKEDIPVILVINKVDNNILEARMHEMRWQSLGFGEPIMASASTGRGVGDLLDAIYSHIASDETDSGLPKNTIKVSLIGKPNVGKSSLFNALIGEDVVIVSDIPHTTRETYDTLVRWGNQHILFIDTAGIRKKSRVDYGLENRGVKQSLGQIHESDIVLFILDSSEPISHQDKALAGLIEEAKKPIIVVANKWDKVEKNHEDMQFLHISEFSGRFRDAAQHYMQYITNAFRFLKMAPIIYVSALTKKHVLRIFPLIEHVNKERQKWINPVELDREFEIIKRKHLPTRGRGVRHPEIHSLKQIAANPPVFQVHIKHKTDLHDSYLRYLQNQIRRRFGFEGVPIVFYIKK